MYSCNLWPVLFNWIMCEIFQSLIIWDIPINTIKSPGSGQTLKKHFRSLFKTGALGESVDRWFAVRTKVAAPFNLIECIDLDLQRNPRKALISRTMGWKLERPLQPQPQPIIIIRTNERTNLNGVIENNIELVEKKIKESWNSNFKAPVLSLLLLRPSFSSLSGGAKKRSPNQACPYRISHLIQFKSLERISSVGDHWADSTKFVRLSRFLNLQAGLF